MLFLSLRGLFIFRTYYLKKLQYNKCKIIRFVINTFILKKKKKTELEKMYKVKKTSILRCKESEQFFLVETT